MSKTIYQLIPDIYKLLSSKGWFTDELREDFSREVGRRLQEKFSEATRRPSLRLSQMGPRCPKALWLSLHSPELAEALPAWAEMKFSYGHILEAWVICLAKAAGHEVTGEQDALVVDGIVGHRDCVIDGSLVDVKSAASFSFSKIKESKDFQDTFGYLDQLDGYLVGSHDDPLVRVKDKAHLLVVDKSLGHLHLHDHNLREESIRTRIAAYKEIAAKNEPPKCTCGTRPDGKSGNIALDTRASYSPFKHECFPGLRTFLYSSGPVYLSKVARPPQVTEIDRHGKLVYN